VLINIHAKFEDSSSNCSRDMDRVRDLTKAGHVTNARPL